MGSNILNPGVAKAKRLGSLKVAEPVKDSIFGGAATGASGIFKPSSTSGNFGHTAAAKPLTPQAPPAARLEADENFMPSSSSLSGASLQEIQNRAIQAAQMKLEQEIAKLEVEYSEMVTK